MSSDDRRSFQRVPFDADTQIRQGQHAWSVVLIDISLNGLLIEEPFGWDIDKQAPASATIILKDGEQIEMEVCWRHAENKHAGFECEHIDIDSISHLRRLIEINLGDSKLMERELSALGQL